MKNFSYALLAFIIFTAFAQPLMARRGGGGFRSSGRSFSRSTRSTTRSRSSFSSNRSNSVNKKSYNQAKRNNTVFNSKAQAESSFKSKNASKYSSKFATKPQQRPDYIPRSTTVNNQSYNINYNSRYGGYGYTNALGTFVLYSALSDTIMLNTLMRRNHYYYGSGAGLGSPFGYNRGFFNFALILLGVLIFSGIFNNRRRY